MTAKTVSPPGWFDVVLGDSLFWLLDGHVLALLGAIIVASVYATFMTRRV